MTDKEKIIAAFSALHASPSTIEEVMKMTNNDKRKFYSSRMMLVFAAVICLTLALTITAFGAGKTIFGWGNNAEIRVTVDDAGISSETYVHTDDLTEPVVVENERMIFIANNESLDITDKVSTTDGFIYEFEDAAGVTHYLIIGLNSSELENYGYGEFMKENGQWIGGYSARTDLDVNGDGPAWLENGKSELNIPW